jgi:hypothetical protein
MLDAPVTDAASEFLNPFEFDPWKPLFSALPFNLDGLDLALLTEARANLAALIEALDFEGDDATPLKERLNEINEHIAQLTLDNWKQIAILPPTGSETPNAPAATATAAPSRTITDRKQAADALRALDELLTYFADGKHWTRGRFYRNYDGRERRCLVGALDHLSSPRIIDAVAARVYLHRALNRKGDDASLIGFNDRARSFKQLHRMIDAARELACQDGGRRQWCAPMIPEGKPLTEPECAKLAQLEASERMDREMLAAADAHKRRLLVEIELDLNGWRGPPPATSACEWWLPIY